jgi:nitroreductase
LWFSETVHRAAILGGTDDEVLWKAAMLNPDGKSENNISLFEAMYTARAMRWLKPDPIPAVIIEQILEAAIQAPNAGNRQNWLFMVVRDPEQRRRIGEIYLRVSSWVLQRYQHQSKPAYQSAEEYEHMMQGGLHLYEHMGDAPVLLIPCLRVTVLELPAEIPPEVRTAMREAAPWTAGASIYPAVQNIILACRALGLGTVLTTNHTIAEEEIKEVLNLPPEFRTFALMPIGYPERNFGRVKRRGIAEVAMLDRYGTPLGNSSF